MIRFAHAGVLGFTRILGLAFAISLVGGCGGGGSASTGGTSSRSASSSSQAISSQQSSVESSSSGAALSSLSSNPASSSASSLLSSHASSGDSSSVGGVFSSTASTSLSSFSSSSNSTATSLSSSVASSQSSNSSSSQSSSSVSSSNLSAALQSGDAGGVTRTELVAAIGTALDTSQLQYASLKQSLFNLNSDGSSNANTVTGIDWNPGTSSVYMQGLDMLQTQSILPNNWSYSSNSASTAAQALALAGRSGDTHYVLFGGHPFGVPGNSAMDQFVLNTVKWLTQRADPSGLKVVIAQQPNSYEPATRSWFANHIARVTINGVSSDPANQTNNLCDNASLQTCLIGADLLVVGMDTGSNYSGESFRQVLSSALAQGIPVLYTHSSWNTNDLSARVFAQLGVAAPYYAGNYFSRYGLKSFSANDLNAYPAGLENIQPLLDHLEQGSFTTDWSGCSSYVGTVSCADDSLYMNEFGSTAAELRSRMRALDAQGTAIFASADYQLEKLLVLLGDKYRAEVAYSSSFKKEDYPTEFFRALFSDVTSFMTRSYNQVAQNLGNFSGLFADNISTLNQTVTITPPVSGSTEYATGLYVLPGKSVTLTRTDTGTESVSFGINILRDTSRPFNVMDRPTQLGSPRPALAANASITINNPYGGPLYLFVDAASGQPDVSIQVSNVITHPILRDPNNTTEVAEFQQALNTTPTNWVVMATEMVTLHSNLPKFEESLSNYSANLSHLVEDTWTYFVKDTYELAGFNSASGKFSLTTPVSDFCNSRGWDCTGAQHRRDLMQHVVADEWAYCGAGCSGNPYDQNWAFGPLGWGETHEVGHNLQVNRLKIYGGISAEVSNNIFPLHKHIHYNRDQGSMVYEDRATIGTSQPSYCTDKNQSVAACVFTIMKTAAGDADPTQTVYSAIWSNAAYAVNNSERVLFYRQLVEFAKYYNTAFDDGWELYTLLYLLERNFSHSSGASWAADASLLGFDTYASYPSSMNGNDFMVIASSQIIGRDMRPVFDLWGITYSTEASAQVAAYSLLAAAKYMFPMKSLSASDTGVGTPVVVSGAATYPAGY